MRFDIDGGAGECRAEAEGLYWTIDARVTSPGADAPRLFCDGRSLGHFLPDGGAWRLQTRVSMRTCPVDSNSRFSLQPSELIAYDPEKPLPGLDRLPDLVPVMLNGRLFLQCKAPPGGFCPHP